MALPSTASAFPTDIYTESSALAQGRWVKVAVETDGVYLLSASRLRSWGFTDLSKVVVRGYGGRRQTDALTAQNYVDDLPLVQSVVTDKGIVFYGVGSGEWTESPQPGYFSYRQSDYSVAGHYFVGLADEGTEIPAIEPVGEPFSGDATTTFTERVQHELESSLIPGEAGPMLVGEDFRYTRRHKFTFDIPDAVENSEAWFQSSFVSNHKDNTARLNFFVEGVAVPSNSTFKLTTTLGEYVYGAINQSRSTFDLPTKTSGKLNIDIELQMGTNPAGAWLNYLVVNYKRHLRLPASGVLNFNSAYSTLALDAGGNKPVIWDVTDPYKIKSVAYNDLTSGGKASWAMPGNRKRNYAAWLPTATFPEPRLVGNVPNQNLHGFESCDMVIVAPSQFYGHAMELADLHANSIDTMRVAVVTPDMIYNEFSSGTVDPGGIRRFFKMLYDRGNASGRPLRYAILFARTTLDNKGLSPLAPSYPTIPSWMPPEERGSVSDNTGYTTDDFMAMLDDGSGTSPRTDKLSIAIGRIPATSDQEATDIVAKIKQYSRNNGKTAWKHRFMFLADDQNNGVHVQDSELIIKNFGTRNPYFVNKVYMDAYELIGSEYPEARKDMFRYLEEGVVWWNFIGHASPTGWTHEHQLSYTDLNNMYLRHWPFIYAATCDFLRLDSNTVSGGEILFKERYGGAIGMLSAVRPVYIVMNSYLSDALGRALGQRDENGRLLPPGEICRRAKNDLRNPNTGQQQSDDNRLRYVFVGDPALRLAMPSNLVLVDSINGIAIADDAQPTLAALSHGTVSGYVAAPDSTILAGFNGTLLVDIFDAEYSVTTLGHGTGGTKETFETHGNRIYTGSAVVKDGRFTLDVAMPQEISQNFRPASMSLYAYDNNDDNEAVGLCNEFYVYGFEEPAKPDTTPPVIEMLVLNHEDFRNGDKVNTSPMLIASVSDDVGINVSSAGVGHQITAILDGRETFTGIANYYTPSPDGSPSGVVNYPMDNLQPGAHNLTFRIWDTSGNSAEKSIDFAVTESLAPKIYDVYSDANPASTTANFYLRHNQPDNMVTVTITVYNLLGTPLWSRTVNGRSDMFLTMPVTWNLTDNAGRRVARGIYLYRASITSDGQSYETASRRIAVTAR